MQDALKQELTIGDVVSFIPAHERRLVFGVVKGFTKLKVEIAYDNYEEHGLTINTIKDFNIDDLATDQVFPKVVSKIS